jgi:hypothetical protein
MGHQILLILLTDEFNDIPRGTFPVFVNANASSDGEQTNHFSQRILKVACRQDVKDKGENRETAKLSH